MVSIFFDLINIPKSSTKREQSMSFTHLTMSLILMPNKVGDKMFPCGTPCSCLMMMMSSGLTTHQPMRVICVKMVN